jgi:NADPH:quinone reductase-like Zn-dependent oxidoreductase
MPELRVHRDDLTVCDIVDLPTPVDPADGEALLQVERFALTANNISYARLGDRLGYWSPFPADGAWGRIPAWGYARVVASRSADAVVGQRVFGLVPMGTHLTVRPVARSGGFTDVTPHRAGLSPIYHRYMPVTAADSDAALIMRPLFGTAVLLDLLLAEAGFAGIDTVVLTSASSKTAYGLAHLLRTRPVTVVGVTSPARRAWLAGLGLYDVVLDYDRVDRLAAAGGAVLVDFAGDRDLLRRAHQHLGDSLRRSILVGFTHGWAEPDDDPPPGPAPQFFFAPDEMLRRRDGFARRYAEAWQGFAPLVDTTMRIVAIRDGDQLRRTYLDLLAGRVDPATGYVVTLG